MANTFELISAYTASGSVSSIDFTSIPSTYTDLVLEYSLRDTSASWVAYFTFNGSGTSYSSKTLGGSGSSVYSNSGGSTKIELMSVVTGATANTFSNGSLYIPNYAGSSNKSISLDGVTETNSSTAYMQLTAGLWSNTAAITSISITPAASYSFLQYSTAYLYGVKNA